MNLLKLEKISNKEFQIKSEDRVLGILNIEGDHASIKIVDILYNISKIGGNLFTGLSFEITENNIVKFVYKTSWFGFGGMFVDGDTKYRFSPGGGDIQTWHRWTWKNILGTKGNVFISARADERSSLFDGSNKIRVDGNIDEKMLILLVLLARYFQFTYISGR